MATFSFADVRPASSPASSEIDPALLRRVHEMQARLDPLLSDSLLALPEGLEHRAHYVPQRALKCLADLLHSHAEATAAARQHGGRDCLGACVSVEPGDLAYLLQIISFQMEALQGLPLVESALQLREIARQSQGEMQ